MSQSMTSRFKSFKNKWQGKYGFGFAYVRADVQVIGKSSPVAIGDCVVYEDCVGAMPMRFDRFNSRREESGAWSAESSRLAT